MREALLGIVLTFVAIVVVALIVIYTGWYDVSVANRDSGVTEWVMRTAMENSVRSRAEDIQAPELNDLARIASGATHYSQMCAGCHGAPGQNNEGAAMRFNPAPPYLGGPEAADEGEDAWTPAELFWIIKNGIKMTAMPAFGGSDHSDGDLWNIVAFMRRMPTLSSEEYQLMVTPPMESDTTVTAHP
jgi:mono/diheme cytochrome c family protein